MWILQEACEQISIWQQQLPSCQNDFTVSVNISAKQFEQDDFIAQLDSIIDRTGIDVKYLKLEITESLLMKHTAVADLVFGRLKAHQI